MSRAVLLVGLGLAAPALAVACSASGVQGGASQGTGGSGGAGASATSSASGGGASNGNGGAGGDIFTGAGGSDGGIDPDAACGLITKQAKVTPLNLYIAFDKSSSMVGTKWDSAKAGLGAFVNDADSAGIKVALNFFPLDNNATCDQMAYKPPVVPYAPLPQNATPIVDAMNAASPNGFTTPIYPALGGAILASIEVAANNPGEAAAVLLVTDGQPQGPSTSCGGVNPEDPAVIASLASKGATMYGIRTFVVGLPGVNATIANQIAAAGGTDKAILVASTNVQTEFQTALAKVRGQALPCEYDIPTEVAGGQVDPTFVNVLITPSGGQPTTLPQDAACNGPGWKYDDPVHPQHIIFCPTSCTNLKADLGTKVQILLGCQTEVAK